LMGSPTLFETVLSVIPGRANGSRECAPDDRLRANPE
jgi:hypothetical protein